MRLSCGEIRRLFWQLVLAVERRASAVLAWSWWRRWHQARARYHHYRKRQAAPVEPGWDNASEVGGWQSLEQQVAQVWQRLEALLPVEHRVGRRYGADRRVILEAIVYVMRSGCGWEHLPKEYPPWKTVHSQLMEWQKSGIWHQIWRGSEQSRLEEQLQL